jgi:hypothetical protein
MPDGIHLAIAVREDEAAIVDRREFENLFQRSECFWN